MVLTQQQKGTVASVYPNAAEVYCSAAGRVYKSSGGSWEYTGCCGPISIMLENDIYYTRMFALADNQIIFEQELYQGFSFTQPLSFFVTFEGNDCIYGVSFADDNEANTYCENLEICVADLGGEANRYTGGAPEPVQTYSPPPAAAPKPVYNEPPPQPSIPTPTPQPSIPAPAASSQGPVHHPPMSVTPIAQPQSGGGSKVEKKPVQKKKGGGIASRLFGGKKKSSKPAELVIGTPTNFTHEAHIGWGLENGFDIRNIPPEWKKLFQAAGVKKSDLKDVETRKLIVSTISNEMGGGAPPPPAPPPPCAPPPPAAPPPPSAPAAPPPPGPPPPPAAGGGPAGGGLQAALLAKT